jgi:hypothetical protein
MVVASQQIRRPRVVALAVVALLSLAGTSSAIEVRHVEGVRYAADLGRAYAPCTAPNTLTSTGIPACTPAVTSACDFGSSSLDLRKLEYANEIGGDAIVNNVEGPGDCATGPYTMKITLRISANDAACAGGECTLQDVTWSIPLSQHNNDFRALDFTLESLFPGAPTAISNYEILDVWVLAPDGLVLAAAGMIADGGADVRADFSTAYAQCTAPDTANVWGVPACSAPTWESACDFTLIDVNATPSSLGPRLQPAALGLTGVPASCANGTYAFVPRVRITTEDCGTPCTLVDLDVPLFVDAVKGEIERRNVLLSSDPGGVGVGFLGEEDTVQLLELRVRDAAGDLLAGAAVTPTLRLDRARIAAAFKVPAVADDRITIKADFPYGPLKPVPGPPLDPTLGGVTFTATGKAGVGFTATIPASAWFVAKPGRFWIYKDPLGTNNGIRKAVVKEFRRGGSSAGYKVQLLGKDTNAIAASQPALDLAVTVSTADGGTAVATRGTRCKQRSSALNCK